MEKTLLLALSLSGLALTKDITYHYVDMAYSWFEAQDYCREEFVDLVTVENQEDSDRLLEELQGWGSDAWIGLLDDMNSWMWAAQNMSFNNNSDYSNWEMEKLNNTNSRSKCAVMKPSGVWLDLQCQEEHLSVCYDEERPDAYILVNESMTWRDAKKFCRTYHTDLAFVTNSSENERVASLLPADAWIGLARWNWTQWSDRTRVDFTNWVKEQPYSQERMVECAVVEAATAMWRGADCYLKQPFICYNIRETQEVRVKLKFLSEAELQDPAVNQQILEQLHVKLANKLPEFVVHWIEKDGQIFHKENGETAESSC